MWGTFNEVMDPWGDISSTLAMLWNYTCTSCQREHFYPQEAPHMCLFLFPHMWKTVASMCAHVRCRSSYVDIKACVFFNVIHLTDIIYKVHLAQSPSMASAVRTQKTFDIVDHSSCLVRSFFSQQKHSFIPPTSAHFPKSRFCYVTKQRFMENLLQSPGPDPNPPCRWP